MHRSPQLILEEATRTGTVLLGGELEFPFRSSHAEALARLCRTAEQVGAMVSSDGTASIIKVYPAYDGGYYVLDWFRPDSPQVGKIERWDSTAAYTND